MRAHEPKKTARATGIAGARMHIKSRLWWLSGFPRGASWVSVPHRGSREVEELDIDATLIRRAAYGLRKLRGEFPRALGRVVDDEDAWLRGVEAVLAALKEIVHGKQEPAAHLLGRGLFSRTLERDIRALTGPTRAAANRLTWVMATRPKALSGAVRWLTGETADIDDAVVAVQLAHLAAAHGAKRVEPLSRLLAADLDKFPLRDGPRALQPVISALSRQSAPSAALAVPKSHIGVQLRQLLAQLMSLEPKRARRVLSLVAASDLHALIAAWHKWWLGAIRESERARNIGKSKALPLAIGENLEEMRRKLVARRGSVPLGVTAWTFREALLAISLESSWTKGALRLVDSFPARTGDRCAAIYHVSLLARPDTDRRLDRIPRVLSGMTSFFAGVADNEAALAPWRKHMRNQLAKGHAWATLIDADLLDVDFPAARIPLVYETLLRLAEDCADKEFDNLSRRVGQIFEAISEPDRALAIARALHQTGLQSRWLDEQTVRGIDAIGDPATFAEIAEPLIRLHDETREIDLGLLAKVLLRAVGGQRAALRAVLVGGDLSLLVAAGSRLALLRKLKVRIDPPQATTSGATEWISDYPAALGDALRLLARATESAPSVAEKLVASVMRSPAALRRERQALTNKLTDERLPLESRSRIERRAANLDERLTSPPPISASKLAKLHAKICRRATSDLLGATIEIADRRIHAALAKRLEIDEVPTWLLEPTTLRVLGAVLEQRVDRELAFTLLRRRTQPAPWDLRDARPNAEFIARCGARGLKMEPWLDGVGERESGTDKAKMILRLEDDPLEIFYMGQHFGTCLSIGQCNFFSVFANAADINKRVIYARDQGGTVVGRRLVCLSDSGALIAFRAYAHDHGAGFQQASDAMISELAIAMNTTTAARGKISTLVAKDWYDDGSIDVAGRFDFLADGSPFRRHLAKMDPAMLAEALDKETGRAKVDGILAPMLAALPEFAERPPLSIALVRLIADPAGLPGDVAMRLAAAALRAGAGELAASMFADTIETYMSSFHRTHHWLPNDGLEFLARVRPSRALALLRQTRGRGIRRWTDEHDGNRLLAGARCLIGLKREKQARVLLEHLLSLRLDDHSTRDAERLLAELS